MEPFIKTRRHCSLLRAQYFIWEVRVLCWVPLLTLNLCLYVALSSYSVLQGSYAAFYSWPNLYNPHPNTITLLLTAFSRLYMQILTIQKPEPNQAELELFLLIISWLKLVSWIRLIQLTQYSAFNSGCQKSSFGRAHEPGCSLQSILHTHPAATTVRCGPPWAALLAASPQTFCTLSNPFLNLLTLPPQCPRHPSLHPSDTSIWYIHPTVPACNSHFSASTLDE